MPNVLNLSNPRQFKIIALNKKLQRGVAVIGLLTAISAAAKGKR